jgi:tetratricopeptide (TPR) repeat protein
MNMRAFSAFVRIAAIVTLVAQSACAPKIVPAPVVVGSPKYPEFVVPRIPQGFLDSPLAAAQTRGWALLQSGDLKRAEQEFTTITKASPSFFPAETSLGYVALARTEAKSALPHFDRALALAPTDVSALVGRGRTLVALQRESEAVSSFEAALAVDRSLTDIERQVEVLKFQGVEQGLVRAREAAGAGRLDDAIQAYTAAVRSSPDSPFLYRELAAVERRRGDDDAALEHFRKAVTLDTSDAKSLGQIGQILESRGDTEGATKAYVESLSLEPNTDIANRLENIHAHAELEKLPAEYRAIDQAPQISRADLAALIGIRLGALLQDGLRNDAVLITDIRSSWAATWIMFVARAGVMESFANHTFQPRNVVRRADLAQAVARLLTHVSATNAAWSAARIRFPDLAASHLAYPAASAAVASGAMQAGPDGSFQPSRPVTGAEAIDAITRIEGLAGLPPAPRP